MTDYEIALAAHDAAFTVFAKARDDYRAMKIGDVEFLAAKAEFDVATAAFDAAFFPRGPLVLTHTEFRSALKSLGVRQRWLAERLGVAYSTVNRWATGELPVAPYVPFVLDLLRERREIVSRLSK